MISRKKEETTQVKSAIQKAVSYELTIADMAQRSERRAWQVAAGAIVLSLVLAGGYFMLLPLKQNTPFIVMADPYTGNVQASRLVSNVMDRTITANEALNRANVERYVLARESFDAEQLLTPLGGWRQVNLSSSAGVASSYRAAYSRLNPANPVALYGRQNALRVRILSTVLIKTKDGLGYRGATVRFQRFKYDKKNGQTTPLDSQLATIDYEYNRDLKFEDQDRVINPLGFQVTSYRLDADASSLPAAETIMPPAAAPAAPAAPAEAAPAAQPMAPPEMPPATPPFTQPSVQNGATLQ